jgi:hypothetical protein
VAGHRVRRQRLRTFSKGRQERRASPAAPSHGADPFSIENSVSSTTGALSVQCHNIVPRQEPRGRQPRTEDPQATIAMQPSYGNPCALLTLGRGGEVGPTGRTYKRAPRRVWGQKRTVSGTGTAVYPATEAPVSRERYGSSPRSCAAPPAGCWRCSWRRRPPSAGRKADRPCRSRALTSRRGRPARALDMDALLDCTVRAHGAESR